MDTSQGISDDMFSDIKSVVSSWYDDRRSISMLKVVYKDLLPNAELSKISSTIDMLNLLHSSGDLSSTDLTLLYDTINMTNQFGLQNKIKADILTSFPNVKEFVISSRFSHHRQKIAKFGNVLGEGDIEKIDGMFNTPKKNYADCWIMISDLENKLIICEEEMETFITKLKKLKLNKAVKTLDEDINSSSIHKRTHQTTQQDIRDEPKVKRERNVADHASGSHQQQLIPDISQGDYLRLLNVVSKWWKRNANVNMLKVLLRQFMPQVKKSDLQTKDDVMDLFLLIGTTGELSKSKLTIIFEAVKLCGLNGVDSQIQEIIPSFQSFNEVNINIFSHYRQKLITFGCELGIESIRTIGQVNDIDENVYNGDQWLLLWELEDQGIIKENSLTDFIKLLRNIEMHREADVLDERPQ